MHLISQLVSGIVGAELGTVNVFRYGTAVQAEIYSSFDGGAPLANPRNLDARGGLVLYSNELCTVQVKNAAGAVIRSFVDGVGDASVEVRSTSFNGVPYGGGDPAPGEPTTVRAVLNLWKPSAGAEGFKVLGPSGPENIRDLVARFTNVFFNVRDVAYGAVGNGIANDTAAFAAANAAAAAAGGGIVFLPPGVYLTDFVSLGAGVSLIGSGGSSTELKRRVNGALIRTAATNGGLRRIANMTLTSSVTNAGFAVDISAVGESILLDGVECYDAKFTGDIVNIDPNAGGNPVRINNCYWGVSGSAQCAVRNEVTAGSDVLVTGCTLLVGAGAKAYGASDALFVGQMRLVGNFVIATGASSGTLNFFHPTISSNTRGFASGNRLSQTSGATFVAFALTLCTAVTDSFEETGTAMPVAATNVLATLPAAMPGYIRLGTRDGRAKTGNIAAAGAAAAFDAANYAIFSYNITFAGGAGDDITLSCAAVAPVGARMSILVRNPSPTSKDILFGANMKGVAVTAIASGRLCGFEFVSAYVETSTTPLLAWFMVGSANGMTS